jgi:hypothetical protein
MGWDRAAWREAGWTLAVSLGAVGLVCFSALGHPAPFWGDDALDHFLPLTREIYRAAMRGELALVTPRSWAGGAIAGEFEHGTFSPVIVGVEAVAWTFGRTLRGVATIAECAGFAILAAGTFRFARAERMDRVPALVAVIATVANGWMIEWATDWYPVLTGFVWIPWLAWGLRRESRTARTLAVAVFLWFILASGWPWTVLIAAVVMAWMLVRDGLSHRSLAGRIGPALAGSLLATMLAAPALLSMLEYAPITERAVARGVNHLWLVPLNALPSLVWPAWVAQWSTWGYVESRTGVELAGGAVPVLVLLAAWWGRGGRELLRAVGPYLVLAMIALVLAMSPSVEPLRISFRWLPLFHMAVGLAGAGALPALDAARGALAPATVRSRLLLNVGVLGLLVTPALAWNAWAIGLWRTGAGTFTVVSCALFALLALAIEAGTPGFRRAMLPAVAAVWQLSALQLTPTRNVPFWQPSEALRSPEPMDRRRTHLLIGGFDDFNGKREMCRPGNTPLLSDLTFVNGYTPFGLVGMNELFHFDVHGLTDDVVWATGQAARPGDLLDRLGIDALVLPRTRRLEPAYAALEANGWRRSAASEDCVVCERGGPPAPRAWSVPAAQVVERFAEAGRVRESGGSLSVVVGALEPTGAQVAFAHDVKVSPALEGERRVDLDVDSADDARGLVVVKRAYYPGYRAWLDGNPLPVGAYDGVLVAVVVPPHAHGRLEVLYDPPLLKVGYFIAAGGLVFATAGWGAVAVAPWCRARRTRRGRRRGTPAPSAAQ